MKYGGSPFLIVMSRDLGLADRFFVQRETGRDKTGIN